MKRIFVVSKSREVGDYLAFDPDAPEIKASAFYSADEAVGILLKENAEHFGLKVTDLG